MKRFLSIALIISSSFVFSASRAQSFFRITEKHLHIGFTDNSLPPSLLDSYTIATESNEICEMVNSAPTSILRIYIKHPGLGGRITLNTEGFKKFLKARRVESDDIQDYDNEADKEAANQRNNHRFSQAVQSLKDEKIGYLKGSFLKRFLQRPIYIENSNQDLEEIIVYNEDGLQRSFFDLLSLHSEAEDVVEKICRDINKKGRTEERTTHLNAASEASQKLSEMIELISVPYEKRFEVEDRPVSAIETKYRANIENIFAHKKWILEFRKDIESLLQEVKTCQENTDKEIQEALSTIGDYATIEATVKQAVNSTKTPCVIL